MARDTCRLPGCENEPGSTDTDATYRESRFCSPQCDVKYDHLKADAEDARREIEAEAELDRRRERHFDRHGHF